MALDVSALSVFDDEISSGLAKEIILGATTLKGDIVTIKYGVIGDTMKLNNLKSTMYGVSTQCGFTDTGSTILSQTTMQLCGIQFQQSICLDTLKKYWYDWYMEREYNTESLGDFADVFYANKVETMQKEVDKIIWRGSSSSPTYGNVTGLTLTGNLLLCDGFFQNAYENSASTVNVLRTAMTISNAYGIVDTIVNTHLPEEVLDNVNLYLSPRDFQTYLSSLRLLNLYNYNTQAEATTEILHPGSIGLHVVRTNGMDGMLSGSFIATPKENLVLGVSAKSDLEFKTWFSADNQAFRMNAKLKFGTAFHFPELVVVAS